MLEYTSLFLFVLLLPLGLHAFLSMFSLTRVTSHTHHLFTDKVVKTIRCQWIYWSPNFAPHTNSSTDFTLYSRAQMWFFHSKIDAKLFFRVLTALRLSTSPVYTSSRILFFLTNTICLAAQWVDQPNGCVTEKDKAGRSNWLESKISTNGGSSPLLNTIRQRD